MSWEIFVSLRVNRIFSRHCKHSLKLDKSKAVRKLQVFMGYVVELKQMLKKFENERKNITYEFQMRCERYSKSKRQNKRESSHTNQA